MTTVFDHSNDWHAAIGLPANIFAGQTYAITDHQQQMIQPYLQNNLALHVGDCPQVVQQHRIELLDKLQQFGVKRLQWLNQTHSTIVHQIDQKPFLALEEGDALITQQQGIALMIMTADCLPIVLSNAEGTEVACLHAGWRGLANGIIESTIMKMQTTATYAWIGAAISQPNFEVGEDVKNIFIKNNPDFATDFLVNDQGKFLADLYNIARKKLYIAGVRSVTGGNRCSFAESNHFYSYRRQAMTGRMATFVFIAAKDGKLG